MVDCSVVRHREEVYAPQLATRRDGGLFRRPSPRRGICSSACHATRWWTVRRPSPCRYVQPSVVLEVRPPWVRIESVRAVGLVECVVRLDVFRRCAPRDAMVDCSVVRHREEVYAPQLVVSSRCPSSRCSSAAAVRVRHDGDKSSRRVPVRRDGDWPSRRDAI